VSITTLVAIQSSEHNSIALRDFDHEGKSFPMITCESSGESHSFHFDNSQEAITFLRRAIEAIELRW
jgi:hypothetical protein